MQVGSQRPRCTACAKSSSPDSVVWESSCRFSGAESQVGTWQAALLLCLLSPFE